MEAATAKANKEEPLVIEAESVDVDSQPHTGLVPYLPLDFIREFNRSVEVYRQFKVGLLALTEVGDWVKFGDSYYLQASGAQRMAAPLGIAWYGTDPGTDLVRTKRVHQDGSYTMLVSGKVAHTFYVRGAQSITRVLPITGRCYSTDKFIVSKAISELRRSLRLKKGDSLPEGAFPEIREQDIVDKANANFICRAITIIGGLRNPPAEMFEEAQKLNKRLDFKKIRSVSFAEDDDAGSSRTQRSAGISGAEAEKLEQFKKTVKEISRFNGMAEADIIQQLTEYPEKKDGKETGKKIFVREYDRLSDKWLQVVMPKANAMLDKLIADADNNKAAGQGENGHAAS
jgi:hypothetical protein